MSHSDITIEVALQVYNELFTLLELFWVFQLDLESLSTR